MGQGQQYEHCLAALADGVFVDDGPATGEVRARINGTSKFRKNMIVNLLWV
jgi:hypothetical protein